MNIQIRKAAKNDMGDIFNLVKELAIYERAPNEVITSPDVYEKDFETGCFDAIVAVDADKNDAIIGMALYYPAYSTWKGKYLWLEDFIVKESYRSKGIGKLLFDEMIDITKKQNTYLEWQVLDWNEPAINFYKKYNTWFKNEWLTCRLIT